MTEGARLVVRAMFSFVNCENTTITSENGIDLSGSGCQYGRGTTKTDRVCGRVPAVVFRRCFVGHALGSLCRPDMRSCCSKWRVVPCGRPTHQASAWVDSDVRYVRSLIPCPSV